METRIFKAIATELPTATGEDYCRIFKSNPDDFKTEFIEIILRRIHHCEKACLNNLAEARICDDVAAIIIWTGGHFSIQVHEELNWALKHMPHTWNRLVWQQIVRQMYEDEIKDETLFRVATEALLVL